MKTAQLFRTSRQVYYGFLFVLFLFTTHLYAQSPVNFSGKWQYDKDKSIPDKLYTNYDGTITMEIVQTATNISFIEIYTHPERPEWKTSADSYTTDGKEKTTKSDAGTSRKIAQWSPDKQVLTITNIDIQTEKGVAQKFEMVDTLKISNDGKMLILERYRNNPVTGELKSTKVYIKK